MFGGYLRYSERAIYTVHPSPYQRSDVRPLPSLPSLLALLVVATAGPLGAQSRVTRASDVRAAPDGNVVAEVRSGTTWESGASRDGYTLITLEGWTDNSRFVGRADSFPQSIGGSSTLRLRSQPSLQGRILGEWRGGAGLHVLETRGSWSRVRRAAWIRSTSLARTSASNAAEGAGDQAAASASGGSAAGGALRAGQPVLMHSAPTGALVGQLDSGAVVQPIERDRGWVRIRMEAWVAESLLTPADTAFGATLTAADLRMDPEGTKGRIVRWDVQVMGLQEADALRPELRNDEPYLLAMGPGVENAVLYIAVPPSLMEEARKLEPLAKVLITARVRSGRSEPTGAPVLDLVSLVKR